MKSIIEYFYDREKTSPDTVFLRQPMGDQWLELTFAQAGQEARRMVNYLAAQGLQRGDHIGLMSKNCYHWILADLAIMMGGYVSVPYYASLSPPQLAEVIPLSDIKLLFVGKLEAWGDRQNSVPDSVKVVRFPHYKGNAEITVGDDWNDIIANTEPLENGVTPNLDDLWTIKFTSGTTGSPKGVMHDHRTPSHIMIKEEETGWIGLTKLTEQRYFSFLPLNHVAERLGVEIPAIYFGGSISFAESLDTFVTNKIAATGAAITPAYIKDFYQSLGINLIEAYGMTEVCGSICNNTLPDGPSDSVGQAIPGARIKIHPDTQEVLMKTPFMMRGYYKDPEKTNEVLVNGWLHSGDRGTLDDNGYVRIIGRVGDAFKTAKGSYVIPNAMEEEISDNDYIEQVCVVGNGLAQPLALVNLSELGLATDETEIKKSLNQCLETLNKERAKFEHISTCVVMSEAWSDQNNLLTPTLKVRRGEIDNRFQDQYQLWHEDNESIIWA